MKTSNRQGFALAEILVATAISAALIALIGTGLSSYFRQLFSLEDKLDVNSEITALFDHILRVGRAAGGGAYEANNVVGCTGPGFDPDPRPPDYLECQTQKSDGVVDSVRFRFLPAASAVVFEHLEAGNIWRERATYKQIQNFIVCDDIQMLNTNLNPMAPKQFPTEKDCPLEPKELSISYRDLLPNPYPLPYPARPTVRPYEKRFFRFAIIGVPSKSNRALAKLEQMQGSFYVRNPLPPEFRIGTLTPPVYGN